MTAVALATVRHAALTLSKKERAALARDLVVSLDGPADDSVAEAWDREFCRRIQKLSQERQSCLTPRKFCPEPALESEADTTELPHNTIQQVRLGTEE